MLDNNIHNELKSLSNDIHDLGAGITPENEVPVRWI